MTFSSCAARSARHLSPKVAPMLIQSPRTCTFLQQHALTLLVDAKAICEVTLTAQLIDPDQPLAHSLPQPKSLFRGWQHADSVHCGTRPESSSRVADRTMYAIHPIPLSEVKALRKHAPKFGWQYVVVVLGNGLTLPPLYFTHGGVKALFSVLKQVLLALLQRASVLCACSQTSAATCTFQASLCSWSCLELPAVWRYLSAALFGRTQ